MRHYVVSALILGALCFPSGAAGQDVTAKEREQALHYIDETRDGLVNAVKGLSDAQWTFKPAPDRWSVAEIVEHLAIVEEMIKGLLGKLEQAPAGAPDRNVKQVDTMILTRMPDRTTKAQSPPAAVPSGRWAPPDSLDHYLGACNAMAGTLRSASDLRAHVINHPAFGPLDGYQWILAAAGHTARHTKQILEVKADPHFPPK